MRRAQWSAFSEDALWTRHGAKPFKHTVTAPRPQGGPRRWVLLPSFLQLRNPRLRALHHPRSERGGRRMGPQAVCLQSPYLEPNPYLLPSLATC